jgi:predicted alpha/beta hydrolase family esterase
MAKRDDWILKVFAAKHGLESTIIVAHSSSLCVVCLLRVKKEEKLPRG